MRVKIAGEQVRPMKMSLLFLCIAVLNLLAVGCGGRTSSCNITATIQPPTATADHSQAPPGNQVQFSTNSTATGTCPSTADTLGVWSTSDPSHITISNQAGTNGLATCVVATVTPATISNSGLVRGTKSYTPATLTCQ